MKIRKIALLILPFTGLLTYCGNTTSTRTTSASGNTADSVVQSSSASGPDSIISMPQGHNSRNSLAWAGTYEGTLPCADCEGIRTIISLNNDQTYHMEEEYLGKNRLFKTDGKFEWNEEGSIITLKDAEDDPGNFRKLQVREGSLLHLDQQGNIIEGSLAEYYVLKKHE